MKTDMKNVLLGTVAAVSLAARMRVDAAVRGGPDRQRRRAEAHDRIIP